MSTVVTYQNVVVDQQHVRIKKPSVYSTRVVWNILYCRSGGVTTNGSTEQPFMVQTPWMVIPYPVVFKDESKTFQFTCCHDEFCHKMQEIETHILNRVNTAHVDIHNKKVLSTVRTFTNDKILKLTGNTFDTAFFDQHGKALHDAQCLSQHKRICLILFIKAAWCSNTYFGLDVVPLQIKVEVLPKLTQPCFLPEPTDILIDDKYRKMIRMRIPMDAVRNRMKLDGHNDAVITSMLAQLEQEGASHASTDAAAAHTLVVPTSLPDTLPASPPRETPQQRPMLGFLSQIKSGDFKLKKTADGEGVEHVERKLTIDRKLSKLIVDKPRQVVPSLDDILLAKERLRTPQKEMIE